MGWRLCREVAVWVWSDELVDRFPAMGEPEYVGVPLVAYAIEGDADLEVLARDVLLRATRERIEPGIPGNPGVAATR